MMTGYAELRQEQVWRDQFVPKGLRALVSRLEAHYDPGVTNIGAYGDSRHLSGYHRSRNWILQSGHCTNRFYSVTETWGNRDGGNGNWISGVDIGVGHKRSLAIWERLNDARAHGSIPSVRQVLLERAPWHVHISLDRAHANNNHDNLFAIIIGDSTWRDARVNVEIGLPVLRDGSDGADVVTAQYLLAARGHHTKPDGDFGPDTHTKTLAMQQHYGAEHVDGIWGPETWTIAITGEDRL